MESLLDTHAFLWYLLGDFNLGSKAKEAIDTKTGLYSSIASLWEISIKINVGKLQRNHSLVLISSDEAFDAYPIRRVC